MPGLACPALRCGAGPCLESGFSRKPATQTRVWCCLGRHSLSYDRGQRQGYPAQNASPHR